MSARLHGSTPGVPFDFSANINPCVTRNRIKRILEGCADAAMRYPEPRAESLVAAVAERHAIPRNQLIAGNGSIELFYALPAALRPSRAFTLEPTFCEYAYICGLHGITVHRIAPRKPFVWDLDALARRLRAGDMLFVCNPNNPTGSLFARTDILRLAATGAWIVVDEAFMGFTDGAEALFSRRRLPGNVIVIRSLTKLYAIPGLRAGICRASKDVVATLDARLPHWNVSAPAVAAATAFVMDDDIAAATRTVVDRERAWLASRLGRRAEVFPGAANFLLCRMRDARSFRAFALTRGIALRSGEGFQGLDEGWFRCAVRTHRENMVLAAAIDGFIRQEQP